MLEFSEQDIDMLEYERFNHPSPRVQRKMEVLYLKALGFRHKVICKICRISSVTLVDYLRKYQEGGIERLKLNLHKGKKSELLEYEESLELILTQNPPQSTKQAAAIILKHTGVNRGLTQVREFLKHLGFKYRKTAAIPKKIIDEEYAKFQDDFKENELEPRIAECKKGERDLFFWMPPTSSKVRS